MLLLKKLVHITDTSLKRANLGSTNNEFRQVERIFIFLQILTACFVAFAHGANDVANAIGPLSAAVQTINQGAVAATSVVPMWALALGGVGIIVGLATYGWRVMETVGKKITELTPSRGFCAEFGAATTIVIASKLALPISTTHTLVGAVLGRWFSERYWRNQLIDGSGYCFELGYYDSSRCSACNHLLQNSRHYLLTEDIRTCIFPLPGVPLVLGAFK